MKAVRITDFEERGSERCKPYLQLKNVTPNPLLSSFWGIEISCIEIGK